MKKLILSKWKNEQEFDIHILDWKPELWYDVLTFYVIESDNNKRWKLDFNAKLYYKKELASGLGTDITTTAQYKFSHEGEKMGYGYLDYFDEKSKWIKFPSEYGFEMYISE